MANKNSKYFNDLAQEIEKQRASVKNQYNGFDSKKDRPTYDNGFQDGVLAGLKVARSLWWKNNPDFKERGDKTSVTHG